MAWTTTILNSSDISFTKVAICFIRRSTEDSDPVFSNVVMAKVAIDLKKKIRFEFDSEFDLKFDLKFD